MEKKRENRFILVSFIALFLIGLSVDNGAYAQRYGRNYGNDRGYGYDNEYRYNRRGGNRVHSLSAPVREIEISSAINAVVKQANRNEVILKGSDYAIRNITVNNSGHKLKIYSNGNSRGRNKMTVVILTTDISRLNDVEVKNASTFKLEGNVNIPSLSVEASGASLAILNGRINNCKVEAEGASTIKGHVVADQLKIDLEGASTSSLNGTARILSVDVEGASILKASGLRADSAKIEVEGASKATVKAQTVTELELKGGSVLNLIGKPQIIRQSIVGASRLNMK